MSATVDRHLAMCLTDDDRRQFLELRDRLEVKCVVDALRQAVARLQERLDEERNAATGATE